MLKKWSMAVIVCILLLTVGAIPAAAAERGAHIFVDGVPLKSQAVTQNGSSFVPFRELFERLGMTVEYDAKLNQVTGEKKGLKLTFTLGSKTAYVNGEKHALQAAPFTRNGATYIPVRIVGEATGNAVYWTAEANLIQINSPSFKGASYTVDGIPVMLKADGTILMGPAAAVEWNMQTELAERDAINNFVTNTPVSRIVGQPPTEEQSKDPGYKGYPDYFDANYVNAVQADEELPPLMSEGWISLPMLAEIENVNRINSDSDKITLATNVGISLVRFDIVLTDEYKQATDGDFVLSDIRVKKYKNLMYLNIEDLQATGLID